jgi:hypothetical protein
LCSPRSMTCGRNRPACKVACFAYSAMLCALVVNVAGAAGSSPITASDFFVIKDPPPEPLDDGLTEAERAAVSWRASGG